MTIFNKDISPLILTSFFSFTTASLCFASEAPDGWRTECVGHIQVVFPGEVEIATNSASMLEGEYKRGSIQPQFSFSDGQNAGWSHLAYLGGLKVSGPLSEGEMDRLFSSAKKDEDRAREWAKSKKENEYGEKLVFETLSVLPFKGTANRVNGIYDVSLFVDRKLIRLSSSGSGKKWEEQKDKFNDFLRGVESREINVVPHSPGICIPNFFIKSEKNYARNIAVTYRLKSHPDITVWLEDASPADYDTTDRSEAMRAKNAEPERRIDDFWGQYSISRTAKDVGSIWKLPIKRSVKLAGQDGLASFVQITRKDDSIDYGYFAAVRGNPNAKEDEPDLRLYVIREGANAREKGLEPVSEKDFLKMAETIAASVQKRSTK
jgi:hypothetical protein